MYIIHRRVFHLKHSVMQIGFCLSLQVEPTHMGSIDGASLCVRTAATTPVGFIEPAQHKRPMRVNISIP
jgi:hypothetical protein